MVRRRRRYTSRSNPHPQPTDTARAGARTIKIDTWTRRCPAEDPSRNRGGPEARSQGQEAEQAVLAHADALRGG